jgi:hypothetical protein
MCLDECVGREEMVINVIYFKSQKNLKFLVVKTTTLYPGANPTTFEFTATTPTLFIIG